MNSGPLFSVKIKVHPRRCSSSKANCPLPRVLSVPTSREACSASGCGFSRVSPPLQYMQRRKLTQTQTYNQIQTTLSAWARGQLPHSHKSRKYTVKETCLDRGPDPPLHGQFGQCRECLSKVHSFQEAGREQRAVPPSELREGSPPAAV